VIGVLEILTWWGEAPERLAVFIRATRRTQINVTGWDERRAEPWSIAGSRLGASIGVTDQSKWFPSIHPGETSRPSGSLAPPSWATFHLSLFTFHRSVSAEHNLDCSLNGGGLGLYAGAELIFRGGFKGDRVGTMIEGEIRGFGHDRELFVPNTTLD